MVMVDVWHADAREIPLARVTSLLSIVGPDERARSASRPSGAARDAGILAHAMATLLVAARSGCRPAAVRIGRDLLGRPLVLVPTLQRYEISLTHGHGFAAVAVSEDGPIGLDGERLDRRVDIDRVLALVPELGDFGTDPSGFLTRWTAVEAAAKASGLGLLRFLATERRGKAVHRWHTTSLRVIPGVVLSLALPAADQRSSIVTTAFHADKWCLG